MENDLGRMILEGCAVALGGVIAWVVQRASAQLERLTDSVNELNLKVAQIIGSVKITETELLDHKRRIEKLERKKGVVNGTGKIRSRSHQGSA